MQKGIIRTMHNWTVSLSEIQIKKGMYPLDKDVEQRYGILLLNWDLTGHTVDV